MAPSTNDKSANTTDKTTKEESKDKEVENKEVELSEEDKQLKEELELLVETLKENDREKYEPVLAKLTDHIRSSTTSMTSVPKPLKFLQEHYDSLKNVFSKWTESNTKKALSDILSVIGMTVDDGLDCLNFKLTGNTNEIGTWGHEYVRHLTRNITQQLQKGDENDRYNPEILMKMVENIVPYLMSHNAEAEACDCLMDINHLELIERYVSDSTYSRVCLYLTRCYDFVPEPEDKTIMTCALSIYKKYQQYVDAMMCALRMNERTLIEEVFNDCLDPLVKKQLAYLLGRQHIMLDLSDETSDVDEFVEIMSNSQQNTHFLALARELDIMEPKVPEDVYKSHLEPNRPAMNANVDSARVNLAASFVNGLLNAGFGQDKLFLVEDGSKWMYKHKEQGMMSSAATLGLLLLWDVDSGLTQIDKYLYSAEDNIKAGALMACGIVNCGVRNECDPAFALLSDYVLHNSNVMRIGSIVGLGLAYAGSGNKDVIELILPVLEDSKSTMEVLGLTALSCGLVAVGTANPKVTEAILETLLSRNDKPEMKEPMAKMLALGLGLTYLGRQEEVETSLATLDVLNDPFKSTAKTILEMCGYAGTGNVLKVQNFLHICSEHYEPQKDEDNNDKKDSKKKDSDKDKKEEERRSLNLSVQQSIAVLGIALISMGEDIGSEMSLRTFGHLLRYGEAQIRRAVPLAFALLAPSNPKLQIIDTLSKFSHDSDSEVAHNAILAMGIVGAGTNNARLAAMLRQLAIYHSKDAQNLFCVRIAQGLVHMGKGTMTINPFHTDRQLMSPVAVAGLLTFLVSCLDVKQTILGKCHYVLFYLVTAIHPRMLVTFDENLQPISVSVRVGQAVDVVGQAGKPKTITGFQTHTTPVLLAYGERAELATDEYIATSPILEGFVILKKNPDSEMAQEK